MKKFYTITSLMIVLIGLSVTSFAQTTTRTLVWNLAGSQNWPTTGAGKQWTDKTNWVISGTSTNPATDVTNGDKLIIPNTAGVVVNITSTMTVAFSNFAIESQGVGTVNIKSGNDLSLTSASSAFSLYNVSAGNGLTLERRASAVVNTRLLVNSIVKALNNSNSALTPTAANTSTHAAGSESASATSLGYGGFLLGSLPVVLADFSVALSGGKTVSISWTTAQELNSDHFDIQKSTDGSNWTTIATVKAAGNSSLPVSYKAGDAAPVKGANFYRLRMVDLDGSATISTIKNVRLSGTANVSIYPNPSVDVLNVSLGEAPQADWSVAVVNNYGQLLVLKKFSRNTTLVSIPVNAYPAGQYTLQIQDGSSVQSSKFMVAHQ